MTIHSSPAHISANAHLMLRPGVSWEQCHYVKARAACRQDMKDRRAKGHHAAIITSSLLSPVAYSYYLLAYYLLAIDCLAISSESPAPGNGVDHLQVESYKYISLYKQLLEHIQQQTDC